jgi:glycosyltransferase involved in cell wall biosynthesis
MKRVRGCLCAAQHIFFVSQHNHRLMEEQTGQKLANASVVRNPFLVEYHKSIPWPKDNEATRLACIGRLYPMEKGQDILLRVMAQPKRQARNVTVDFYGSGSNLDGLTAMADHLGCKNVQFKGHVSNIEEVWKTHHGLVLASRAEGLPLVLVETTLAGRVAIISQAGGSAEVIDDGKTAFLMKGYDEEGLDDAMERSWNRRGDWPEVGMAAAAGSDLTFPRICRHVGTRETPFV